MPNNYQIYYEINALDKASAIFDKVDKRIRQMNKNLMNSQKYHQKLSVSQKGMKKSINDELAGRAKVSSKLLGQISLQDKLRASENKKTSAWAMEINHLDRVQRKKESIHEKNLANIRSEENARRKSNERDLINQHRLNQRNTRERRQNLDRGYIGARTAMMYTTAPTALAMAASLKNMMAMEQLDISLGTLFGDDSKKVGDDLRRYAYETQFTLREANQMMIDIKKGEKTLGLKNVDQMMGVLKTIGNVVLSYATRSEDKQEIAYQIGQGFMRGRFNERQDIKVMAAKGLPIYAAAEEVTGMAWSDIKSKFGAEVPAEIILAALEYMNKSPEVARSLEKRSKSLTLSWEQFKDSIFFVSSEYGEIINQTVGVGDVLKSTAATMFDHYLELEKGQRGIVSSSIKLGTTWATLVPTLVLGTLAFEKMIGFLGGTNILLRRFANITGVLSLLYATTTDWQQVVNDFRSDGVSALSKHFDSILATAIAIVYTIKKIRKLAVIGSGAATVAGGITSAGAGAMVAPITAGVGAIYALDKFLGPKPREALDLGASMRYPTPDSYRRYNEKLKKQENKTKLENNINIEIKQDKDNNFNVEKVMERLKETPESSSPFDSPIYVLGD